MNQKNKLITKLSVATIGFLALFSATAQKEVKVAFNQSDAHPQYIALQKFGEKFAEKTEGRYAVKIFPNEQLGDQRAALELVQNGVIHMSMAASPLVENYDKNFKVIGMPYIYNNSKHQEKVFTSGILDDLFLSTKRFGFEVLTAYTAGARSVYTKGENITDVASMKGKKVRVMQSDTMIKMLDCLGGVGVPMSQGEVYSAISQGILDGAENNEITYTDLKHYEVAPYFSATQHLMVPDLLIASQSFIDSLSPEDQKALRELAKESTKHEFELWAQRIEEAKKTAKAQGATFVDVDVAKFKENCKPLQDELVKTPEQKALVEKINSME